MKLTLAAILLASTAAVAQLPQYTPAQCALILNRPDRLLGNPDAQRAACLFPNDPAKQAEWLAQMGIARASNPSNLTVRRR
jgi:hypothetical protein